MRRRDFLRIVAAAGIALAVPGWLSCRKETALRVGDVPPETTLADLKGKPLVLPSAFLGRVALIHFWASWCPLCREEMKALEVLYNRHGRGIVIPCSVGVGENREGAEAYIRTLKISYPVLPDGKSTVVRPYGITGIPTTYVLDRGNVIRYRIFGELDDDALGPMIATLL